MTIRGVRGAVTADQDRPEDILAATRELLEAIMDANPGLDPEDLASVFFTVTPDLHSTYPALAARQMGWMHVPLMCACEIDVPESLPRCIRVLLHWNTDRPQNAVHHVYLGQASVLRPDLTGNR